MRVQKLTIRPNSISKNILYSQLFSVSAVISAFFSAKINFLGNLAGVKHLTNSTCGGSPNLRRDMHNDGAQRILHICCESVDLICMKNSIIEGDSTSP